jgi:hypothetical protein
MARLRHRDARVTPKQKEPVPAPQGFGRGRGRGQWDDPRFIEDRKWFHFLLANREKIKRTINRTEEGVDTLTESDDPEVTAGIQTHVAPTSPATKRIIRHASSNLRRHIGVWWLRGR